MEVVGYLCVLTLTNLACSLFLQISDFSLQIYFHSLLNSIEKKKRTDTFDDFQYHFDEALTYPLEIIETTFWGPTRRRSFESWNYTNFNFLQK